MYKICFYVPESHLEKVKVALFTEGAGRLGDYECCAWQVLGEGQFKPLAGSDAFIGEKGKIETLKEWKVELVCEDDCIRDVVLALKKNHPYEEPAYQVIKCESI